MIFTPQVIELLKQKEVGKNDNYGTYQIVLNTQTYKCPYSDIRGEVPYYHPGYRGSQFEEVDVTEYITICGSLLQRTHYESLEKFLENARLDHTIRYTINDKSVLSTKNNPKEYPTIRLLFWITDFSLLEPTNNEFLNTIIEYFSHKPYNVYTKMLRHMSNIFTEHDITAGDNASVIKVRTQIEKYERLWKRKQKLLNSAKKLSGEVTFTKDSPEELESKISLSEKKILSILEPYIPSWTSETQKMKEHLINTINNFVIDLSH